jgi:2-aminomuconate deaminase
MESLTFRTEAIVLEDRAAALARYPHARRAGDFVFVSGVSSRRSDDTHDGVTIHPDGQVEKDIRTQTRAVIENIRAILRAARLDLAHVVDVSVFLVDMADYGGMNEVWNQYFTKEHGPGRTTLAVKALPHPHLLVEMKATAYGPMIREGA